MLSDDNDLYLHLPDSCADGFPDMEYEGLWVERWPNGELKYRGRFQKRRRKIGQHVSFWENGEVQEMSFWDEGYAIGTILWFRDDGTKECEKDFGECGGRTRYWAERHYDTDSMLSFVYVWKENLLLAKWTRPDLRAIKESLDADESADA